MASRRKNKPLRGNGRDGLDYRDFLDGLLQGTITATLLIDTTVPQGSLDVHIPQRDANDTPLPDVIVTVNERRLTKLDYDDPNG